MTKRGAVRIGVLDLQGAVSEHLDALRAARAEAVRVKRVADLEGLRGLIIPGGESTAIGRLAAEYGFIEAIPRKAAAGLAVWGTCAGLILLAKEIKDGLPDQVSLGLMDIVAVRNGFGRQVDSFEVDLEIEGLGFSDGAASAVGSRESGARDPGVRVRGNAGVQGSEATGRRIPPRPFRAVFIRAPYIERVRGEVEVLAEFADKIVAARQGRLLATAFHPELAGDARVHRYFVEMVAGR